MMPRTYAAKRLLEHGPLTFAEMLEITGWNFKQVDHTLQTLIKQGIAVRAGRAGRTKRYLYGLAE